MVTVNIEGKPISCLIDTGSQVSTITESYFRDLLKSEPKLIDVTKWMRVSGANHLPIPYIGYIEVEIDTAHYSVPNVGILVVKDPVDRFGRDRKLRVPGVLGK